MPYQPDSAPTDDQHCQDSGKGRGDGYRRAALWGLLMNGLALNANCEAALIGGCAGAG